MKICFVLAIFIIAVIISTRTNDAEATNAAQSSIQVQFYFIALVCILFLGCTGFGKYFPSSKSCNYYCIRARHKRGGKCGKQSCRCY